MKVRWIGFLGVTVVLIMIITACNATDSKTSELIESKLVVGMNAQPPTLDTHISSATVAQDIARNIFETLVTLNSEYQAVPMLAESVEKSDDGKTYTFNLREGVLFHNGKEMTSEDVVASMNRWVEFSSAAQSGNPLFKEKDNYTVTLQLKEPMIDILDIMVDRSATPSIMPKEIIESAGPEGVKEYIGTGPFKFVEWKQGQNIHLSKFENYQPVDSPPDGYSGKKEALVEDIFFEFVSDPFTRVAGLETGEYDIITELPYDRYDELDGNNAIKTHIYQFGTIGMVYNKKQGLFSNLKLRQAVNAALNSEDMIKAAFVNEQFYSLASGYMDVDQKDWYSDNGKEEYNQNNSEKAKQLLEEAGYKGEVVRVLTTRDYDYHYNGAVVMKEQLEQIGMNIQLDVYDRPTLVDRRDDPEKWEILGAAWPMSTTPTNISYLRSDWPGWTEDDNISQLLEKIQKSTSKKEAKSYWDILQGYAWSDYLPISVIGKYSKIMATSDKVEGFTPFEGGTLWNTKIKQ